MQFKKEDEVNRHMISLRNMETHMITPKLIRLKVKHFWFYTDKFIHVLLNEFQLVKVRANSFIYKG